MALRTAQLPVADDLERVSAWLDAHPELLDGVASDLGAEAGAGRGRHGLSCEAVLRCALLMHLRRESYRGLEFLLRDSLSAQRFARVDAARPPRKSALQATIGALGAASWERINRGLLETACAAGLETGARVRVDSTVTATHILAPADSRLLYDGVRVLTRLLGRARDAFGADAVAFHDHRRAAKRRALEIGRQRGKDRRAATYRKLLRIVARTRGYAAAALPKVAAAGGADPIWRAWREELLACGELLGQVVSQTERRVFGGETVPAREKVVSLFEPHTDIIVKSGRGTHYGHKVNLTTGRSGLVLDVVVEDGNPADSSRCVPMLERHVAHYGAVPTHAAFDGGYASRENLKAAKALGVAHAVFHKKRGMKAAAMTPSSWVHAQLKRFRAGIEAGISYLKRCFGLGRCRWRGLAHFQAYVQGAVVAHNLVRLARLGPAPG
ncbi:MAG: ISNCY family transposase [Gammaproteobacteria bacterium]|nr:ISNCY family transposase [Gammaproteobacteria bacterium]